MKIVLAGAHGRMGRAIADVAHDHGAAHEIIGLGRGDDVPGALRGADILIDFTAPETLHVHVGAAVMAKKPVLVGTTGLGATHHGILNDAAKFVPVLHSANTSLGITILERLVTQAAALLDDSFDIEIFEAHHRNKVDAPSGTALILARAAADGRKTALPDPINPNRTGKRTRGDIGFSVFRGGDIIGDHTVTFAGTGERIELTHKATSRSLFAAGALKAAQFLVRQEPGLYTMQDVADDLVSRHA